MAETYRDKCRHFNGIQHDCCKAGVRYKDVEMRATEHPRVRLPCADFSFAPDVRVPDTCPARSFLTQEEHAEDERELQARATEIGELLAAGKCFVCKGPIEPSRIVGRCKYAACGHRLGQVADEPKQRRERAKS